MNELVQRMEEALEMAKRVVANEKYLMDTNRKKNILDVDGISAMYVVYSDSVVEFLEYLRRDLQNLSDLQDDIVSKAKKK